MLYIYIIFLNVEGGSAVLARGQPWTSSCFVCGGLVCRAFFDVEIIDFQKDRRESVSPSVPSSL
jgi:hypothetical protein